MPNAAAQRALIGRMFDRAPASYDRIGHALFAPAGAALVELAGLRPGDRVLDVGCGGGASLFPAAEAVGGSGSVTGIDLAPSMVRSTAADIVARGVLNATARVGCAESPGFPPQSFDAVLAGFVLFFLPDPTAAVANLARLLRPGGRLTVSTFVEPSDQEIVFTRRCRAAVAPYLGMSGGFDDPLPLQRLRTTESVVALFATGFVEVESTRRDFECPAECWCWLWSGGIRGLVDQAPTERVRRRARGLPRCPRAADRCDGRPGDRHGPVHHCPPTR